MVVPELNILPKSLFVSFQALHVYKFWLSGGTLVFILNLWNTFWQGKYLAEVCSAPVQWELLGIVQVWEDQEVLQASSQLLFSSEISPKCFAPLLPLVGLKVHWHQVFFTSGFLLEKYPTGLRIQTLNLFRIRQFKLFLLRFFKNSVEREAVKFILQAREIKSIWMFHGYFVYIFPLSEAPETV